MKILIVIKRYSGTIGKDAILDNFGREIRIAEVLSEHHDVTILAADHIKKENKSTKLGKIQVEIRPFNANPFSFIKHVKILSRKNEIVIGTTHQLFALLAYFGKSGKPFVYDMRDNYETYDLTNIPLLKKGFFGRNLTRMMNNFLVNHSVVVTCVSKSLQKTIKKKTLHIPNGVESIFKPLDRKKAKTKLNLKGDFITYVGHISKERGTDILIASFEELQKKHPKIQLLLTGAHDKEINIDKPGIVYRDYPKREDVVLSINSAEVAVLPQPLNETTKYTFPYKLMEYMACNTPVVATRVGDVQYVLKNYPNSLANVNDAHDLMLKIEANLGKRIKYDSIVAQHTWKQVVKPLELALSK